MQTRAQTQVQTQSSKKPEEILIFHARTKHIEIEHNFIKEKILESTIATLEVQSEGYFYKVVFQDFFHMRLSVISKRPLLRESVKSKIDKFYNIQEFSIINRMVWRNLQLSLKLFLN